MIALIAILLLALLLITGPSYLPRWPAQQIAGVTIEVTRRTRCRARSPT
jgi:hypothetical protein